MKLCTESFIGKAFNDQQLWAAAWCCTELHMNRISKIRIILNIVTDSGVRFPDSPDDTLATHCHNFVMWPGPPWLLAGSLVWVFNVAVCTPAHLTHCVSLYPGPARLDSLLRAPRSTFRAFLHSGCEDITVIYNVQSLFGPNNKHKNLSKSMKILVYEWAYCLLHTYNNKDLIFNTKTLRIKYFHLHCIIYF